MDKAHTLAFSVFALCLLLLGNLFLFYHHGSRGTPVVQVTLDLSRPGQMHLDDEQIIADMLLWPALVQSAHVHDTSIPIEERTTEFEYLKDCWNDPDWFRMYADPQCMLLWMRTLEHATVSYIDNVLPVVTKQERDGGASSKPQQNGGIRCKFQGSPEDLEIKGYWKPCRGEDLRSNSESFSSEIIAFHIDHILGFYRTPAVVPRVFSKRQFELLANEAETRTVDQDPKASEKIESVEHHCGRAGGLFTDGAMVGWSPKEVQLLSKHIDKKQKAEMFVKFNSMTEEEMNDLKDSKFNIKEDSNIEDIHWALENVYVNLFAILTNNFGRFGHNLFIQVSEAGEYGPFVFIDNDRSKWKYDLKTKGKVPPNPADHPLASFCKFPKQLARRLMLLESLKHDGISLGKLVYLAIETYQDVPSGPLFTKEQAKYLDMSASYIVDIIDICLDEHPEDDVLFEEPGQQEYDFFENIIQSLSRGVSNSKETFFLNNLANFPDVLPAFMS